jgi:hypothetical protein
VSQNLKFEISNVELIQEVNDSMIAILRVFVCHDGNNAHNMPISLETIKLSAENSLRGKPILYKVQNGDFMGHEYDEIPAGYFIENQEFEYIEQDGKTFLVAQAALWKAYAKDAYKIFLSKNRRPVSMEILVLETEENEQKQEEIKNMAFQGVTMLGENRKEACVGSHVKIIKFSDLVTETEKLLSGDVSDINIFSTEKEEEKTMAFNKQEYAEKYSLTANQLWDILYAACSQKKYQSGDDEYCKYWVRDYDDTYIFAYDNEDGNTYALNYTFDGNTATVDFESAKRVRLTYIIIEENEQYEEDKDSNEKFAKHVLSNELQTYESVKAEFETKITNLETEKTNLTTQFENEKQNFEVEKTNLNTQFETEKTELNNQIKALTDENTNLKEFKSNIEIKEFENSCISELEKFKEVFAEKDYNEWLGKIKDFTAVVDFTNALKIFAFDKNVKLSGEEFIHIPMKDNNKNQKSQSVWDRI